MFDPNGFKPSSAKIILHIGLPRCASTTLQILLSEAACYSGCPIYYPQFSRDSDSSIFGHNASIKYSEVDSFGRIINANLDQRLLKECLEQCNGRPIVLSAEDFWRCNPVDIKSSINTYCYESNIKVAYSSRPFIDWLSSLYAHNTSEENKKISKGFGDWVSDVIDEIAFLRSAGQRSIYDLDSLNDWHKLFSIVEQLPYPPIEPLVEIGRIVELELIPKGWRGLNLLSNHSNRIKDSDSQTWTYSEASLLASRIIGKAKDYGLIDLFAGHHDANHSLSLAMLTGIA